MSAVVNLLLGSFPHSLSFFLVLCLNALDELVLIKDGNVPLFKNPPVAPCPTLIVGILLWLFFGNVSLRCTSKSTFLLSCLDLRLAFNLSKRTFLREKKTSIWVNMVTIVGQVLKVEICIPQNNSLRLTRKIKCSHAVFAFESVKKGCRCFVVYRVVDLVLPEHCFPL